MSDLVLPDGSTIYHEFHGNAGAQPLILLEGMGGDIPGLRRNIPRLAAELRVIAFDFRGNGRSGPPPEDATVASFVDEAIAVLDHAGVEGAHVYGQSFGGMVAQELALRHPDRARSLILGCTHAGQRHAVRVTERVPKGRPWLALYAPAFAEAHPEHVAEDLEVGARQRQPLNASRRQWEAIRDWDAYERLSRLRLPALVIHGSEDRTIHPENARVLVRRIPGARLAMLEGAGHVYHSERPEEADRVVLEFVREQA